MTAGVSSPRRSWLAPDWPAPPGVARTSSTLRGGGVSARRVRELQPGAARRRRRRRHVARQPRACCAPRRAAGRAALARAGARRRGRSSTRATRRCGTPPRADAAVAFEPRPRLRRADGRLPAGRACRSRRHARRRRARRLARAGGGVLEATVACARRRAGAAAGLARAGDRTRRLRSRRGGARGVRRAGPGRTPPRSYATRAAATRPTSTCWRGRRWRARESTRQRRRSLHAAAEAADFFSYRRDDGRTGRMATLAWLDGRGGCGRRANLNASRPAKNEPLLEHPRADRRVHGAERRAERACCGRVPRARRRRRAAVLPHLVSFATGTLLGAAFLGLMPHALEGAGPQSTHADRPRAAGRHPAVLPAREVRALAALPRRPLRDALAEPRRARRRLGAA